MTMLLELLQASIKSVVSEIRMLLFKNGKLALDLKFPFVVKSNEAEHAFSMFDG